jgi:transposase
MKSKDLQKLVLSKYECGDSATKIFHDLCGAVSRKTIFNWCKMTRETGSINMTTSPGLPRTIRKKNMIQKI